MQKLHKLVSIIIPCFNSQKWLREAINSCLQQTYPHIEIIVIDDGSTDNSLGIIKSYKNQIIWESFPKNRGGCCARNRGFAISKGEYIQFLDADDYILPEKIARQVDFLELTGNDVVYGDWRHQLNLPDGTSILEEIKISGQQEDILASLISNWWTAVASVLYTRSAVENSGGWDENLAIVQDKDFFISVVMNGAKVAYQAGCYSIYRRYGNVTVSTTSKSRWLEGHHIVLKKLENQLLKSHNLSDMYCDAIALCYFKLARESLFYNYSSHLIFLEEALVIRPNFKHESKQFIYNFIQFFFGFRQTELITSYILFLKYSINKYFDSSSF
ncbi:glycosyltransferase family 2 protein [Mastigocoleus testarum]|uniref:Glycosyl transferase family 2 n=1 Tax=Mastigocoleus testarum BC008 TaxID=371196 RepID=A0A0V7ZZG7_9CYAN|nr:glycosyltransferase [Mastigocoleus testarum]KST69935.1 glycosyl transferase family 2 [Mastigocoleus testarum BC008]KST69948.1 glycosyl transferase family 2 [Mastigocoleus testarum BC008]